MSATPTASLRQNRSYLVSIGFATTVSMWAVAYICRLPGVMAPPALLLTLLLGAIFFWGWYAARETGKGALAGAGVALVASALNMLILGSLLTSSESHAVVPSALWWIPGSILASCLLGAIGGSLGKVRNGPREEKSWTPLFGKVAAAATFLLVIAGGLVTSHEAGLAVVDWPNSFGYSMFLYPLSRMTGGIYYEHAHRLFGSLVGLTTLVLAVHVWRAKASIWVRRLALVALALVIIQGLLGGLRVTGHLTMSTNASEMAPSIALAVAHGVLGQVFLGLMVVLAVLTSRLWGNRDQVGDSLHRFGGTTLYYWLAGTLLVQLILGALQRHIGWGLVIHITMASIVTMLAIVGGARAWWLSHGTWPLQRLGQTLLVVVSLQVALGIAAYAVTGGQPIVGSPSTIEITMATAHQAGGALLLSVVTALMLWSQALSARE